MILKHYNAHLMFQCWTRHSWSSALCKALVAPYIYVRRLNEWEYCMEHLCSQPYAWSWMPLNAFRNNIFLSRVSGTKDSSHKQSYINDSSPQHTGICVCVEHFLTVMCGVTCAQKRLFGNKTPCLAKIWQRLLKINNQLYNCRTTFNRKQIPLK